MNLPVIPAPATASTDDGTLLVGNALGVVVQSAELADVAARFVEDVRLDTGIALSLGSAGITLLIDGDGIDDVAPAAGLRADGQAMADERYGLEITGEGVRVWGRTAEAVHRGLTSLRQLITTHAQDGTAAVPTTRIVDGRPVVGRPLRRSLSRSRLVRPNRPGRCTRRHPRRRRRGRGRGRR